MILIDERKKFYQLFWCFKKSHYTNDKNIAFANFVNAIIALNLHSYEENWKFYTRVYKKRCVFCCSLNQKIGNTYLWSYCDCTHTSLRT